MSSDPYIILGVSRDASFAEINAAFKAKAKKLHPDQGGNMDDFIKVKQASLVLLDPLKRDRFDRDGVIDHNEPDLTASKAMERIISFFINSIEAIGTQNLDLNQLDLVQGGHDFFNLKITECNVAIKQINLDVKKFERVLKRLKTKRKTDVIKTLLTNHMSAMKAIILLNEAEIKIYETGKTILMDYEFTQEVPETGSKLFWRLS